MLMIQTDKSDISQIQLSDIVSLLYFDLSVDKEWRVEMLNHLLGQQERAH